MTQPQMDEQTAEQVAAYQPRPLPAEWTVTTTDTTQPQVFVVVIVQDAAGQNIRFISPDAALVVGQQIVDAAKQAQSGIATPPSGLWVPGG